MISCGGGRRQDRSLFVLVRFVVVYLIVRYNQNLEETKQLHPFYHWSKTHSRLYDGIVPSMKWAFDFADRCYEGWGKTEIANEYGAVSIA